MSHEQPIAIDGAGETRMPIDSGLFTAPDKLVDAIEDEKRRDVFRNAIVSGREGALRYAVWTLGQMAGIEKPFLEEDVNRGIEENPSHGLRSAVNNLIVVLGKLGCRVEIPDDKLQWKNALGRAALEYAETIIDDFHKELELTGDPEKAAAALGIRDANLLVRLSDVASKLPERVIFGKQSTKDLNNDHS